MKFYSWNVNGIRAVVRKGTFQKFVAEHQPDILCLQETKAERGQAEIDLPDYQEYWNSAEKKGYSGTAIFSKREPVKVTNGFPAGFAKKYEFADDQDRDSWNEGRVITAEYEKFYAGASFIIRNHNWREAPWDRFHQVVDKLMAGYGVPDAR